MKKEMTMAEYDQNYGKLYVKFHRGNYPINGGEVEITDLPMSKLNIKSIMVQLTSIMERATHGAKSKAATARIRKDFEAIIGCFKKMDFAPMSTRRWNEIGKLLSNSILYVNPTEETFSLLFHDLNTVLTINFFNEEDDGMDDMDKMLQEAVDNADKTMNILDKYKAYGVEAQANDGLFATVLTMDTPGHDKALKELLGKRADGEQDYFLYKHPEYFYRYVAVIPYTLVSFTDVVEKLIPAMVELADKNRIY